MSSGQTTVSLVRPQRILACVACQQRKIKCDRKFPCSHCVKSKIECTPATKLPRRRRRRFGEQELLDHLRKYEELLRQNNIDFEPLIPEPPNTKESPAPHGQTSEDQEDTPESSNAMNPSPPNKIPEVKSFWHAVYQRFGPGENEIELPIQDNYEDVVSPGMDTIFVHDNSLLFGPQTTIDLSTLHPEPAQMLRLWQLFLDNVNPLFRVVHTPTMQVRLIDAIGNLQTVQPPMEALMFAIYSMAIFSLDKDECLATFSSSRSELLTRYQFGCLQALQNCAFLKSNDRDTLTAFFLYISSYAHSDPKALSSTMAIAIRIAQRMKIDRELDCAQHNLLEGEMRRRLWWAILILDLRICQIAGEKNRTFLPTFSTRVPLNINDAILRPGTNEPPTVIPEQPTEAIYIVVRAVIGDFLRHTNFNLAYNAPELVPLARTSVSAHADDQLLYLEKVIESRYLKHCNPQDPLHFLTIHESRCLLAKCRLMESYSTNPDTTWTDDEAQRACGYAIRILECDTAINASPLVKDFQWMTRLYFPFPAYIHLMKYLRREPLDHIADRAWKTLNDNFELWAGHTVESKDAVYKMLRKLVLDAWAARETALISTNEIVREEDVPKIVIWIKEYINRAKGTSQSPGDTNWLSGGGDSGDVGAASSGAMEIEGMNTAGMFGSMPLPFNPTVNSTPAFGMQNPWATFGMGGVPPPQGPSDPSANQVDWTALMMGWGVGQTPGTDW
ncbi:putative C6 transcription factor [Periconia macrospinosa]|uniref:Putative C6 transcription factor n=1 Tax=Periconia macrospinosa TaxID=97972 RepID=A0A2V1E5E7_9PLEO|nr:putative C6 transcription factor [Periconia macrospinosa]